MRKKNKGDVSWYLPKKKTPFAYSTIAESDTIKVLLEECGDLREILNRKYLLSPTERLIIQTYIDNGIFKPVLA